MTSMQSPSIIVLSGSVSAAVTFGFTFIFLPLPLPLVHLLHSLVALRMSHDRFAVNFFF
jgi:hypothetical protein